MSFTSLNILDVIILCITSVHRNLYMRILQLKFQVKLDSNISFTKCWSLSVRGYNKAGLSTIVSTEIRTCDDIDNVRPSIVIDTVGEAEGMGK
mgnify:CR=1 FL=1